MKSLSFVFALLVLLGFGAPAHAQDNPFKDILNQVVDRVGVWWGTDSEDDHNQRIAEQVLKMTRIADQIIELLFDMNFNEVTDAKIEQVWALYGEYRHEGFVLDELLFAGWGPRYGTAGIGRMLTRLRQREDLMESLLDMWLLDMLNALVPVSQLFGE